MKIDKRIGLIVFIALASQTAVAVLPDYCGSLENAYGPFDYTNPSHRAEMLPKVEGAHFTPSIEQLRFGKSGPVWAEISYTLRAFPNHHRALYAMMRYQLKLDKPVEPYRPGRNILYPIECYFLRAVEFKPSDSMVRMLFGMYFHKINKPQKALGRYKEALKLNPEQTEAYYNLGLLYFDLKNYDASREHADKAYSLGYPLKGLKNKLASIEKKTKP